MPMTPQEHSIHMQKIEQGLQSILQSEDINEIKQIAQSLLSEEKTEEKMETPAQKFEKQYVAASGGAENE